MFFVLLACIAETFGSLAVWTDWMGSQALVRQPRPVWRFANGYDAKQEFGCLGVPCGCHGRDSSGHGMSVLSSFGYVN